MAKLGQITEKEYNEINALRNSKLEPLEKSFANFKMKTETTESMRFGSAFHMYVLEEDTFWRNYIVAPKFDGRSTEGKKIKKQLDEQAESGREILRSDDFDTICKMKDSLLHHPMAKNILKRSENEGAYTATIEGVDCKAKIDLENKGYFFDLKSTDDASHAGFKKSIGKYRYDRQAAFYGDIAAKNGVEFKEFIFVAIEKKAPYLVGVWMLDKESIELGRSSYLKLLEKFKFHNENPDAFDGISDSIKPISAPGWLFIESNVNV